MKDLENLDQEGLPEDRLQEGRLLEDQVKEDHLVPPLLVEVVQIRVGLLTIIVDPHLQLHLRLLDSMSRLHRELLLRLHHR